MRGREETCWGSHPVRKFAVGRDVVAFSPCRGDKEVAAGVSPRSADAALFGLIDSTYAKLGASQRTAKLAEVILRR